jgi:hypothetical protein
MLQYLGRYTYLPRYCSSGEGAVKDTGEREKAVGNGDPILHAVLATPCPRESRPSASRFSDGMTWVYRFMVMPIWE